MDGSEFLQTIALLSLYALIEGPLILVIWSLPGAHVYAWEFPLFLLIIVSSDVMGYLELMK